MFPSQAFDDGGDGGAEVRREEVVHEARPEDGLHGLDARRQQQQDAVAHLLQVPVAHILAAAAVELGLGVGRRQRRPLLVARQRAQPID